MPGYKSIYNLNADMNNTDLPVMEIEARDKEYKHSIVTSQRSNLNAVISHVEGSSQIVDYYSQIKAANEAPMEYDNTQPKLNQQYHLIYNLELKLQGQDPSTEDATNKIMMNATAVVYAGVIPNMGDVIIKDIGAGRCGRFSVTKVEKKESFSNTVYEIDMELVEYMDNQKSMDHLNSYVVKESVFCLDLIQYNNNPTLIKSEYDKMLRASDIEAELIDDYLKEFYSIELGTLVMPNGKKPTYDPFVVKTIKKIINGNEHPLMKKIAQINISELGDVYEFSIWNVLLNPEVNKINNIWKRAMPIPHSRFHLDSRFMSFRYSGFEYCISPIEDVQNIDFYMGIAQRPKQGMLLSTFQVTSILADGFGTAIGDQLAEELEKQNNVCCHHLVHYHEANKKAVGEDSARYLDLVHKWLRITGHMSRCLICGGCPQCCHHPDDAEQHEPSKDKYAYVLDETFWNASVIDDPFNSMVRSFINGDKIDLKMINSYIARRNNLSPKDRFYKMLVMLIILRSSIRGI